MGKFLEISRTGVTSILLHPLRSLVTVVAILAILLPYLVGLGISKGIQEEADISVRFGADLYVSGVQLGEKVPVPVAALAEIKEIAGYGVTDVVPRIVGEFSLRGYREHAVLVGMPLENIPADIQCVEGRLPKPSNLNELVLGTELARRLNVKVGDTLLPFYANSQGERLSQVVGLFRSETSLWQGNVMFTTLETASVLFDQQGLASDFLVYCKSGYQTAVRTRILQGVTFGKKEGQNAPRPQVIGKEDLHSLLPIGLLHREGIFNLHFTLAFAVGILAVLVTSGFGLSERRREIGILKATGWQTDEVLLRSLVESFLLSLAAASLATLVAFLWLKELNGLWIAGIFLTGVDAVPGFPVPFRLTPIPALLAFLLSFVVAMTGSMYSSWRAAVVAPAEAMR